MIENSFGILASRWQIFHRPIIADPEHVVTYTKAAVALHNFLHTTESSVYFPPGFLDSEDGCSNLVNGSWRKEGSTHALVPLRQPGSNHCSATAYAVKNTFRDYFSSPVGEVSWQNQHVTGTT